VKQTRGRGKKGGRDKCSECNKGSRTTRAGNEKVEEERTA